MTRSQLIKKCVCAFKIVLLFHAGYILIITVIAINLRFWNPPVFSLMGYRYIFNGIEPKKMSFIQITELNRKYRRLIVSTEDPHFYGHAGIDPMSMMQAAKVNHRYNTKLSGASTITQQLTRTLILFPNKLYIRKYFEVIAAITIDTIIPKDRILELYINYAEWGRGIYGINSASLYYYKRPVYRCSEDEIVRLITVLPSPVRYTPNNFWRRGRLRERYYRLHSVFNTADETPQPVTEPPATHTDQPPTESPQEEPSETQPLEQEYPSTNP